MISFTKASNLPNNSLVVCRFIVFIVKPNTKNNKSTNDQIIGWWIWCFGYLNAYGQAIYFANEAAGKQKQTTDVIFFSNQLKNRANLKLQSKLLTSCRNTFAVAVPMLQFATKQLNSHIHCRNQADWIFSGGWRTFSGTKKIHTSNSYVIWIINTRI